MENTFTIQSENDIDSVAEAFLPLLNDKKVVAFYGPMGVGKTTFIKSLCRQLGVQGSVTSPSFAIVNEYLADKNKSIFHFDFYRLKNIEEVFDLGYEDYFFGNNICFIEWPEKIADVLPEDRHDVVMSEIEGGVRLLKVRP